MFGANFGHGAETFAPLPPGIAHERLVGLLLAGERDLFGVDHHHEIAGIEVRRENGLILPAEDVRDLHRQPPEHSPIGIDDVPFALIQIYFWQKSLHSVESKERK